MPSCVTHVLASCHGGTALNNSTPENVSPAAYSHDCFIPHSAFRIPNFPIPPSLPH